MNQLREKKLATIYSNEIFSKLKRLIYMHCSHFVLIHPSLISTIKTPHYNTAVRQLSKIMCLYFSTQSTLPIADCCLFIDVSVKFRYTKFTWHEMNLLIIFCVLLHFYFHFLITKNHLLNEFCSSNKNYLSLCMYLVCLFYHINDQ